MELSPRSRQLTLASLLILAVLIWRVAKANVPALEEWAGFSPLMAIAVVGASVLPARRTLWLVIGLFVLGDLLSYGAKWFTSLPLQLLMVACLVGAALVGIWLRNRVGIVGLLGATLGCSLGFYLITNTACWATDPGYAKSLGGWLQSLTIGKPGFPPSWMFLRNSLAADFVFGLALIGAFNLEGVLKKGRRIGFGARGGAAAAAKA